MQDITSRVFIAMQRLDIAALSTYPPSEIRPVLPALVRMSLLSPLDNTKSSMDSRKQILAILIGNEVVNSIVSYLQVNYHELELELKKELQARQKSFFLDAQQQQQQQSTTSNSEFGLQTGIALGFERADVTRKVRVVISEIFHIQYLLSAAEAQKSLGNSSTGTGMTQLGVGGGGTGGATSSSTCTTPSSSSTTGGGGGGGGTNSNEGRSGGGAAGSNNLGNTGNANLMPIQSEILEDGIYLEEVVDILCIALAELPSLLNILELTDTLVQISNGPRIICALMANFPDCYREVVTHVITNCDEETPEGKLKLNLLSALNEINPKQSQSTRAYCVHIMKVPSFVLKLSLKLPKDLIAFLTGLLLGSDQNLRTWFAEYIHSCQKRKSDVLILIRIELLKQLQEIVDNINELQTTTTTTSDKRIGAMYVKGALMLRLYCALRGIAGLKFNDGEINVLSQLITIRPEATMIGKRFVSLALCMLIACPSLISTPILETKAIEWLQWLIKDEHRLFAGAERSDTTTSLGEMLLLLAIHFHSNQISAIGELVCSTLAMKIPIRPNSTNRMKQLFTQDLFTEQVVASHAVRVAVTNKLNGNIPGYLPVHCIHQLLKSRAFLKHKVPIKSWIYRQICNSIRPLHPVMPALIEVYVNTLIMPNPQGKMNIDHMHKPFTENEILHIFRVKTTTRRKQQEQSQSSSTSLLPLHQRGVSSNSRRRIEDSSSMENNRNLPSEPVTNVNNPPEDKELLECNVECPLTARLLILYYLVLYEDTRITNLPNMTLNGRKLKEYSTNFLSELPMKYLLKKAHQYHNDYVGIFHPLLRLIIANYPHLSMVEDWLEEHCPPETIIEPSIMKKLELQEEAMISSSMKRSPFFRIPALAVTEAVEEEEEDKDKEQQVEIMDITSNDIEKLKYIDLLENFDMMLDKPGEIIRLLKILLKLPSEELSHYSDQLIRNLSKVFQRKRVARTIKDLYLEIWLKLNSIQPISFWRKTLEAIHRGGEEAEEEEKMGESKKLLDHQPIVLLMENIFVDPLQVLRYRPEIFHCPHTLTILLRILQGSLAASKAHLNIQLHSRPVYDKNSSNHHQCNDNDRDELKTALIASQESAAVHILLEILSEMNMNRKNRVDGLELRETQGIICSFIHQVFISEPSLAKLVHFQTYPRDVIPMMVKGVPSMHICIDFLHEFLSMPEMDKQIFTIDLASHLVLKYAIPKSLNVAKYCVNTIQTALSLLSIELKCKYLAKIIPALIRFADAFPILTDDCINILMLTGRSLYSQSTLGIHSTQLQLTSNSRHQCYKFTPHYIAMIEEAFETLISKIIGKVELY